MGWWHTNHYYTLNATHNYFIDIDDETILKQKCKRALTYLMDDLNMDYFITNNENYIKNSAGYIAD
jgi:hypothetical protein